MTSLMISKATEAKAVATVWNMAAESLDPESYEAVEKAFRILCEIRSIPKEILACEQRILSGKLQHNSDCETSNAPAYVCAPCDCKYKNTVIVSNDSDADEMNRLHGERYGYDWKYEGESQ